MGRYYNPPMDLVEGRVGRQIPAGSGTGDIPKRWAYYKAKLIPGEHLYAVVRGGVGHVAQCVDDLVDFEHATATYRQGLSMTIHYYALTAAEHALAA